MGYISFFLFSEFLLYHLIYCVLGAARFKTFFGFSSPWMKQIKSHNAKQKKAFNLIQLSQASEKLLLSRTKTQTAPETICCWKSDVLSCPFQSDSVETPRSQLGWIFFAAQAPCAQECAPPSLGDALRGAGGSCPAQREAERGRKGRRWHHRGKRENGGRFLRWGGVPVIKVLFCFFFWRWCGERKREPQRTHEHAPNRIFLRSVTEPLREKRGFS